MACDPRSLALLRIGMGLALVLDAVLRAGDLGDFYTDAGVFPRQAYGEVFSSWRVNLHALTAGPWLQGGLLALAALLGGAVALGYRTRWAAAASFALLVSVQMRMPIVQTAADDLLRVLLFWGLFLPWERHFSLDARRSGHARDTAPVLDGSVIGYVVQVFCMYLFAGLTKSAPEWRSEGTAIYYALHLDTMARPLGLWLRGYPGPMSALTHATLWLELIGPFALVLPVATAWARAGAIAAFTLLQIGLASTLDLGLFQLVSVVALLGLLPAALWDRWLPRLRRGGGAPADAGAGHAPLSRRVRGGRAGLVLGSLLALYIVVWNASALDGVPALPERALLPGKVLRIHQNWNLFAPRPLVREGWVVIRGRLADRTSIDPLTGAPVTFEHPGRLAGLHPSHRWRKYIHNVFLNPTAAAHRPFYADWVCRSWNRAHPRQPLSRLEIWFVVERTLPDYAPSTPEPTHALDHVCAAR